MVWSAEAGTLGDVGACLGFAAHSSCECSELLHANELCSHHTDGYYDFVAAMTTEVGLLTMGRSVLRRISPSWSPAHWQSCVDKASGSRPDTNTSHRRLKMFHSSSVSPIFTFGRSSVGPLMTTAARGGPAMYIVEWAANRAHVTDSLHSGVA